MGVSATHVDDDGVPRWVVDERRQRGAVRLQEPVGLRRGCPCVWLWWGCVVPCREIASPFPASRQATCICR